MPGLGRFTHEPDVNLSLNVPPLIRCTQLGNQRVERRLLRRRVLKPCEKIERLVVREISAVVKPSLVRWSCLDGDFDQLSLRGASVHLEAAGSGLELREKVL